MDWLYCDRTQWGQASQSRKQRNLGLSRKLLVLWRLYRAEAHCQYSSENVVSWLNEESHLQLGRNQNTCDFGTLLISTRYPSQWQPLHRDNRPPLWPEVWPFSVTFSPFNVPTRSLQEMIDHSATETSGNEQRKTWNIWCSGPGSFVPSPVQVRISCHLCASWSPLELSYYVLNRVRVHTSKDQGLVKSSWVWIDVLFILAKVLPEGYPRYKSKSLPTTPTLWKMINPVLPSHEAKTL